MQAKCVSKILTVLHSQNRTWHCPNSIWRRQTSEIQKKKKKKEKKETRKFVRPKTKDNIFYILRSRDNLEYLIVFKSNNWGQQLQKH